MTLKKAAAHPAAPAYPLVVPRHRNEEDDDDCKLAAAVEDCEPRERDAHILGRRVREKALLAARALDREGPDLSPRRIIHPGGAATSRNETLVEAQHNPAVICGGVPWWVM